MKLTNSLRLRVMLAPKYPGARPGLKARISAASAPSCPAAALISNVAAGLNFNWAHPPVERNTLIAVCGQERGGLETGHVDGKLKTMLRPTPAPNPPMARPV